ncbi:hypothetical protein M758_2G019000 [Ceratodon purpureus]|nr:hypothetical protein M758_2G019000 [Ceratodon purpureus]
MFAVIFLWMMQGPQYVCTNFSTFVCTPCSGIHREFSHRIKSVSMAKFTSAEVAALQAGGNERARQTFFKSLDLARTPLPDSGNHDRLRDFIKRVYEKRLYTGDTPPPSAQQEEPVIELRRPESKVERPSDLRSLSFDDHVGGKDSNSRRKSDFDRSSVGNRGSPKTFGSPQAPPRPTRHSYDDRDEKIEQQQQSPKPNGREKRVLSRPFSFKDFDNAPPPAQSITDILGDIPGLRVEVFKGDSPNSSARSSVDGRKSTLSAQSFGAVGDDRVTAPTALDHKRDNSSSLIDMNGDAGSTGISRVVEDPFAETSHVSPATSDSWATFNASPTPPAPPGYPAPKTETSQWADSGWGQQTSNLDSWSSFGTPSPPKAVPNPDPFSTKAPSIPQSVSSPGQPPRQRRELPQNFFAPSLEDHLPNMDMHRNQQMQPVFRPPQLDAPLDAYYNMGAFPGNPQHSGQAQFQVQDQTPIQFHPQMPLQPLELSHQISLQPATPTQRSRNPFDDDFDDDSASLASSATTGISMQFPNLDALQAALPPTIPASSGLFAMEGIPTSLPHTLPTNAASPDWAYSFTQFNNSTSPAGSFNFSPDQTASSFQMSTFPVQPNVSGGYMSSHPFGQEAPYPGNQFHTQNVVRPAGGNPFG